MTQRAVKLLGGAEQAIATAQRELHNHDLETASERACVAMLRLAKACLDVDGMSPGPATSVCAAYGRQFGRTGRMYSAYYRWLLDAADLRKASSGDLTRSIDYDAAATAVERAEIFRDAVVRFLERGQQWTAQ
jgi:uncharacterized protein (UPF0332 family)